MEILVFVDALEAAQRLSALRRAIILIDHAFLHNKEDAFGPPDILHRIARHRHYIREPGSKFCGRNAAGAFGWPANVDLRDEASFPLIGLGHFFLKFSGVARIDKIDGCAAETAAGHARTENSLLLVSQVDH